MTSVRLLIDALILFEIVERYTLMASVMISRYVSMMSICLVKYSCVVSKRLLALADM